MELVPSFVELVQQVAPVFTAPTFNSFVIVLTGWVFARRRLVTRMIQAPDAVGTKHHSAFHRVFSTARWSLDELGLAVFALIEPWLVGDAALLSLDDTLARKRGPRLPTPRQMLAQPTPRLTLDICGGRDHSRVADPVARVHAVPDQPLRIVAVEPLTHGRSIGGGIAASPVHHSQTCSTPCAARASANRFCHWACAAGVQKHHENSVQRGPTGRISAKVEPST